MLRGLVKRVLVRAPKELVAQWVQELRTLFHEEFQLLSPSIDPKRVSSTTHSSCPAGYAFGSITSLPMYG